LGRTWIPVVAAEPPAKVVGLADVDLGAGTGRAADERQPVEAGDGREWRKCQLVDAIERYLTGVLPLHGDAHVDHVSGSGSRGWQVVGQLRLVDPVGVGPVCATSRIGGEPYSPAVQVHLLDVVSG
jgi:hypothetical protein